MEFDARKAAAWLHEVSTALPEIEKILGTATSEILVIGAGVFDIYHGQGWIPAFRRKTGDLDLSVGLVSGAADYDVIKAAFLKHGYRNSMPTYRFHTPRAIPGALTYVDLLAHPRAARVSEQLARNVMGIGLDFSFESMDFAAFHSFSIAPRISCPNPLGMIALKMASFQDEPTVRIKDLADIAEVAWGIVETGTHFKMSALWSAVGGRAEAREVRRVLLELAGGESLTWDLEDARQELLKRGFSAGDLENGIPERLKEWAGYLE